MKVAVVLTTINVPTLLEGYADNFEKYGHKDEVGFIVIGDRKTPKEAGEEIKRIKGRGFEADYLDIPAQEDWLSRFANLKEMIPYNSDNRRNVGYLLAVEQGAEIIISIDDDNYALTNEDYLAAHKIVGTFQEMKAARSDNGWYNICRLLETEPSRTIYPRGFPYYKRWADTADLTTASGRVVINVGLWLQHPDTDAVTNLNEPVKVTDMHSERIMLDHGVYTAINTQNTALHRDVLPAYYYILMGAPIEGNKIDRYGDIWSGFFIQKVINHMNERITVGPPLTNHIRNKHNLFNDLRQELWGMILTDYLTPILESIQLTAPTYDGAYFELANKLEKAVIDDDKASDEVKQYFRQMTEAMRIWVDVCREIMK
jgi:hypothetical protein|tara:strand:- start:3608 stop:4723 length:1116 start_codon:yes stop_codon:yes gene_type:complete